MATALGESALPTGMYVVPAIFLKFQSDKIFNDYVKEGIITALDVATIAFSGGTALATKGHWVYRLWAMAEIAGAVGNIAVNTQTITNPKLREAVDLYNAGIAFVGIAHLGEGGYRAYANNLSKQTKQALQQGTSLRPQLEKGYRSWQRAVEKLEDLKPEEAELVQKMKLNWSELGMLDDVTSLGKYSLANVSKELGFIDILPDLLKREGMTMDEFHYMMQKNVNVLTEAEKAKLAYIRNALPKPSDNTLMQKVVPLHDIERYISGDYQKNQRFCNNSFRHQTSQDF